MSNKYHKECVLINAYINTHNVSFTRACNELGLPRRTISNYFKQFVKDSTGNINAFKNSFYDAECGDVLSEMRNKSVTFITACKTLGYNHDIIRPYFEKYIGDATPIPHVSLEKPTEKLSSVPHIATSNNVSFVWNDDIVNVSSSSNKFEEIKQLLQNGDGEKAFVLSSLKNRIITYKYKNVSIENGQLMYKDSIIHGPIVQRVLDDMENGDTAFEKYVCFINNLMENPSQKMKKRIYDFLEAKDIEISDDGYIMAFKVVRSNYLDVYSGTIDNSVGNTITMKREDVDDDDSSTCSNGLHLCSKSYISYFGGSDSRTVLCKLNPRDVVSIPSDYNDAKLRCCKYTVMEDVTDMF